jgi:hypothetical protein
MDGGVGVELSAPKAGVLTNWLAMESLNVVHASARNLAFVLSRRRIDWIFNCTVGAGAGATKEGKMAPNFL